MKAIIVSIMFMAFLSACGGTEETHHIPASDFVKLRWLSVPDLPTRGYFIRDLPDGTQEREWSVPPGRQLIVTDYTFHLDDGTPGKTEIIQLKRRNTSGDIPFHQSSLTLGADGSAGTTVSLETGVVVNSGTELMLRLAVRGRRVASLENWAMVLGYLVDVD